MSPPEPAPRLLRAFLAVAEELHFTRAAARLYIAQQALSRDVRRLEAELGTELLVRSTRRAELTADGERFVPYARRVLAAYEELGAPSGRPGPCWSTSTRPASSSNGSWSTPAASSPSWR